ncbi:gephyrin-like molybdotransferase Glp [Vandammella animalimorsus]|uniref:Molybdopterin molybdenumtransferase n=1 Tax=Vandammella animalimorsus TaxID=2029117 RepID=A0A2A2B204_9BURK|nr:gephyrin-like molybdotransferase Glp [Vandammella animalimorsus]PAT44039.1 molybdopterin molybdenumtransferase MoeA [Vandammella animalimorsus]
MSKDLLDYHDALNTLLQTHQPMVRSETLPLAQLHGRILAEDLPVRLDVPNFDNSAMDGYAICGTDRSRWQVVQRIAAGDAAQGPALQPGQAARIFTGAPIPAGAKAVLMQEHVTHDASQGEIALAPGQAIRPGQHIRRRAEELQAGATLLSRGTRLNPATIGLLAIQGYAQAPVLAPLRVTVFSSGNELVQPGQPLQPGQIYDSNRVMLLSWLQALGFAAIDGGALPDQLAATREALQRAAQHSDAILCSGGVSVGEEDHLKRALEQVGTLVQWRLFIKPGKPFTWGHIARSGQGGAGDGASEPPCQVFMLPGNPVSSLVTFQQLALPALRRLGGLDAQRARPLQWQAQANFSRSKPEPRREFVRVRLEQGPQGWQATPLAQQGSNMLSGAAFANALAETAPGAPIAHGDALTVYPLFDTLFDTL